MYVPELCTERIYFFTNTLGLKMTLGILKAFTMSKVENFDTNKPVAHNEPYVHKDKHSYFMVK